MPCLLGSGPLAPGLWIFALATLPMSLALQSACSQDGLMLALSALAGALLACYLGKAGYRVTVIDACSRKCDGTVTVLVSLAHPVAPELRSGSAPIVQLTSKVRRKHLWNEIRSHREQP